MPQWDVADRLRKAMRHAGLGVQDMAGYLGVTRGTVSTWINGRIVPSTQTLRLWALRCGVSYDWLAGGQSPHPALRFPTMSGEIRKGERRAPDWGLAA